MINIRVTLRLEKGIGAKWDKHEKLRDICEPYPIDNIVVWSDGKRSS